MRSNPVFIALATILIALSVLIYIARDSTSQDTHFIFVLLAMTWLSGRPKHFMSWQLGADAVPPPETSGSVKADMVITKDTFHSGKKKPPPH